MKPTGGAQTFTSPSGMHVLGLLVGGQILLAFLLEMELSWLESNEGFALWLGLCIGLVAYAGCDPVQLVRIEGTTVRVWNAETRFRRRSFDMSEITRLKYTKSIVKREVHCLCVSVRPAPGRNWNSVQLVTPWSGPIDVPAFIGFMDAIAATRSDLKIHDLPAHYRGPLPSAQKLPAKAGSPRAARKRVRTRTGADKG